MVRIVHLIFIATCWRGLFCKVCNSTADFAKGIYLIQKGQPKAALPILNNRSRKLLHFSVSTSNPITRPQQLLLDLSFKLSFTSPTSTSTWHFSIADSCTDSALALPELSDISSHSSASYYGLLSSVSTLIPIKFRNILTIPPNRLPPHPIALGNN